MHHTNDDTEMATIRRSGSGWQVLIRRKNYVGPRSRTFLSRDLAQSWADAVEDRTKKVFRISPSPYRYLYTVRALCVYTHTHVIYIGVLVVGDCGYLPLLTMMM